MEGKERISGTVKCPMCDWEEEVTYELAVGPNTFEWTCPNKSCGAKTIMTRRVERESKPHGATSFPFIGRKDKPKG